MKSIYTIILVLFSLVIRAQSSDHSDLLTKAREYLQEGNCERAEANYEAYKKLSKQINSEIERAIAKCKNPTTSTITTTQGNQTFTVKGVSFEMIAVQGGTFTMGCTSEQGADCYDDEKPAHQVTLSNYHIGKFEVTQELWQAVMGSNPSHFKGAQLPVEKVSWDDAQDFIVQLNRLSGKTFRLPTEAEWEFAARGGTQSTSRKYSGASNLDNCGWYTSNSGNTTHPVGSKVPNELGIYDMSGNVYEWCSDWYGAYSSTAQTNPKGASSGSYRVRRGGSWGVYSRGCRSSLRHNDTPDFRNYFIGFRLALSL